MENERAEHIRRAAIKSATRLGFYQDADDIAQEVVLHRLRGKGETSEIPQMVIDMVRKLMGDQRADCFEAKQRLVNTDSLTATKESDGVAIGEYLHGYDPTHLMGFVKDVERALKCLSTKEKKVFKRYYLKDLTLKEIGEELDYTEVRISQIVKKMGKKLREHMKEDSHEIR